MSYKSYRRLERESGDPWPDAGYRITKKATRIPSPGDRIRVAPQGWQRRARYTAYVRSVNIDAKTVTVVRDFGSYCLPTESVAKLSCCRADPVTYDDPAEPPRQFQFNIRSEPEGGPDFPARFIVEAWWGEWCNSYPAENDYEVWEWIDKLLTGPVCDVCGCQLAETYMSRIVCQRSLEHRQSDETIAKCRPKGGNWHLYGPARQATAETPCETIPPPRNGRGGQTAPAMQSWFKRAVKTGAWQESKTIETWAGHGAQQTVQRPIYRASFDPSKMPPSRRTLEYSTPYTYHDADREYEQHVRAKSENHA